jgi:hypothetical protein
MNNYKFMLPFGTSCTVQKPYFSRPELQKSLLGESVAAKLGAIIDGSLPGHC